MFKRLPVPFIYILVVGILLGLVLGFKSFIPYLYWNEVEKFEWYRMALPHIINYLFWPLLVPLVYRTFESHKIGSSMSIKDWLINIGMSLLVPLLHEVLTTILYFFILEKTDQYAFSGESWSLIKGAFPSVYIGRVVEYWIIYGLFAAFDYYRQFKNKQAEIGSIEAQLNRTKLSVLKMQLQPHFLFNSLNSISSLMDVDVKKAQHVTAKLGDLLRGVLEKDDRIFVRLDEELHYIETYLEIEKIRFEDRLSTSIHVAEALLNQKVPMLIIQPLVENAIKHGVAPVSRACRVDVVAEIVEKHWLTITVRDNGAGANVDLQKIYTHGVGLSNVRARLIALYPDQHSIKIKSTPRQGFGVEIQIPKLNYDEKYQNSSG